MTDDIYLHQTIEDLCKRVKELEKMVGSLWREKEREERKEFEWGNEELMRSYE